MIQKIKLAIASRDNQDGSQGIFISSDRSDCLDYLDRTEEQLAEGSYYDDGMIFERDMEIESINGIFQLAKPFHFDTDGA